jgi:hypothetical protein
VPISTLHHAVARGHFVDRCDVRQEPADSNRPPAKQCSVIAQGRECPARVSATDRTITVRRVEFELVNESANRLTDVVLQLSVVEKQQAAGGLPRPRVLVAPFTIRGAVVLESGYRIDYEVLLRNLSADCACVATVEALSARSVPQ